MTHSEIITVRTDLKKCPSCNADMECELVRETGESIRDILWCCEYTCGGMLSQIDSDDAILDQVDFWGPTTQTITN